MEKEITRLRIMCVDDQKMNNNLLDLALRKSYDITCASGGQECLDLVEQSVPDLILLDIMMPDVDGYEVCKRLRERESTRHIPILLLTALTDIASKERGFAIGATDYITKPFNVGEVRARVGAHLERELLRRELFVANRDLMAANEQMKVYARELEIFNELIRNKIGIQSIDEACTTIVDTLSKVYESTDVAVFRQSDKTWDLIAKATDVVPAISDEELTELVKYDHSVDVFTNEFYTGESSIGILFVLSSSQANVLLWLGGADIDLLVSADFIGESKSLLSFAHMAEELENPNFDIDEMIVRLEED